MLILQDYQLMLECRIRYSAEMRIVDLENMMQKEYPLAKSRLRYCRKSICRRCILIFAYPQSSGYEYDREESVFAGQVVHLPRRQQRFHLFEHVESCPGLATALYLCWALNHRSRTSFKKLKIVLDLKKFSLNRANVDGP